jgi:uncharacterized membrane protein
MTTSRNSEIHRQIRTIRITRFFLNYWLVILIIVGGILNILPFLTPIAMRLGWSDVGHTIYSIYAPLCHQMAQRSFFMFGSEAMHNIDRLPVEIMGTIAEDMLSLRSFTGNAELGWKVAWSDRMVYMYGSAWLASIVYWVSSRRQAKKPISLWLLGLLMLPMFLDGVSHVVSDGSGITQGFRYDNIWLADLTGHIMPSSFYSGDAFGSFNSWMRLLSGGLFGIAGAAFALPIIDSQMRRSNRILTEKIYRWNNLQHAQGMNETLFEK